MSKASEWIEKAQWVGENRPEIELEAVKVIIDEGNNLEFSIDGTIQFVWSIVAAQLFVAWFKENFENGATPEVRKDN